MKNMYFGYVGKGIRLMNMILVLSLALSAPLLAQGGPQKGNRPAGNGSMTGQRIATIPAGELSGNEAPELLFMREEEKLARDVYNALNEKWDLQIFANIARSEQQHFEALGMLISRYNLPDPAGQDRAGVFVDAGLALLYQDLVAQGSESAAAALRVGATIEDLDLRDLGKAIAGTDNEDLKLVYRNLERGSRNHLRAFVSRLEALGETYAAQYIDAGTFISILESPRERGAYGADGKQTEGFGPGSGNCTGQPGNRRGPRQNTACPLQ